jgi:hypothetical protein
VGSIPIYLESFGDENALGFSLYFDPTNFNYAGVSLGSSASGATLNVNTNTVGSGGLACVLALPTGATFPAGLDQVLNVSLQPATNASGFYLVSFADQPVRRETSDVLANTLPTVYGNGTITINPAPPLRIAQSGGNATIAWPSWATGYRVQESAGGLPPATIWLDVSGTPSVTNGEYVITVPLGTGASFYRLSK